VTIDDHNLVMSKVGIADLKARLSEHLRKVRKGQTLVVLDRDTPVARIVPYAPESPLAPLEMRRATRKPGELRLPAPPSTPTDSLRLLLQDRASR
jgi:prevent-host-death family protein